jgi:hypothetical protein
MTMIIFVTGATAGFRATPDDVAETVHWVATLPTRVNVNTIELMPVSQAFAPLAVHRSAPAA